MLDALNIAATGMNSQQTLIDVVANNLANVNTPAFKKGEVHFEDLMAKEIARTNSAYLETGNASFSGLGSAVAAVSRSFSQGDIRITERPLDLAILGQGFFEMIAPDGSSMYTRLGQFRIDADGMLANTDGLVLRSNIRFPSDTESILILDDGRVEITLAGDSQALVVGEIELVNFMNPAGLEPIGDNLYLATQASGDSFALTSGDYGAGEIKQGYLEAANVELVNEMTSMLMAQRGYELNARVIQTASSMLEVINGLNN